jgi:hypothetical protein
VRKRVISHAIAEQNNIFHNNLASRTLEYWILLDRERFVNKEGEA